MFRPINDLDSKAQPGFRAYSKYAASSSWTKEGGWSEPKVLERLGLPKLPITSNTINYGMSVFEGMKAHEDSQGLIRVFRAEHHFQRLNKSLERMALPALPREVFFEALERVLSGEAKKALVVDFENGECLYIRPIVCNSTDKLGPTVVEECQFAVVTAPLLINPFGQTKLMIEPKRSRAAMGGVATAKTAGNYAAGAKAVIEAQALGFKHVAFTDSCTHSYFEECGSTNLYFVWDGELVTPSLDQGTILDGITRRTILGVVAPELDLRVNVTKVLVSDVIEALSNGKITEVFVSGTACTNTPINAISYEGVEYPLPSYHADSISFKIYKSMNTIYVGDMHKGFTTYVL